MLTPEILERIVARFTEIVLVAIFAWIFVQVPDARQWCGTLIGFVVGGRTGAGIADRVARRTAAKVLRDTMRPPNDGPTPPLGGVSAAPPPAGPPEETMRDAQLRRRSFVRAWATLFAGMLALSACAETNPDAVAYSAERLRCVGANDAAPAARACMRDVDRRFGQDGGL